MLLIIASLLAIYFAGMLAAAACLIGDRPEPVKLEARLRGGKLER